MLIDDFRRSPKKNFDKKENSEISFHNRPSDEEKKEPDEEVNLDNESSPEIFFHWRALEFEKAERGTKWYAVAITTILVAIGWSIYIKSIIMSLVFVLVGTVGYSQLRKNPQEFDFLITKSGVVVGKELYAFENIKSFWIFYEPEGLKALSLQTKSSFIPYVQIPLAEEDPVRIREKLLEYIPEEKHELGFIEMLEKVLKI